MKRNNNDIKTTICFVLVAAISFLVGSLFNSLINSKNDLHLFSVDNITDSAYSSEAPNDGSIGLWYGKGDVNDNQYDYYIVHASSKYGQKLLNANLGSYFTIKNHDYTIKDIQYYPRKTYFESIENKIFKEQKEIAAIQVCVPDTDYYKILIGE